MGRGNGGFRGELCVVMALFWGRTRFSIVRVRVRSICGMCDEIAFRARKFCSDSDRCRRG